MTAQRELDRLDAERWLALVALTDAVNVIRAADDAPPYVHNRLAEWLDRLEAEYREVANAHSALLRSN